MPPAAPRDITHGPPRAFQKGVSAQKTPEQRSAQGDPRVCTARSCSRSHSQAANPLQFIFLLLQRQPRARRSANLVPSSILLGWFFFPSILSLSLPLFPCLRAGKTTPACLQGRNVSPDIVSSTRKTLGCFLATAGRAVDDRHVSSHKRFKGGGCNPGQGRRSYRLGCVASGHSLHPGPLMEEPGWPSEPSEALAEV